MVKRQTGTHKNEHGHEYLSIRGFRDVCILFTMSKLYGAYFTWKTSSYFANQLLRSCKLLDLIGMSAFARGIPSANIKVVKYLNIRIYILGLNLSTGQ